MKVLEKILEEIKEVEKEYVTGHKVLYALGATGMATEISNIIRSNMENYKVNELDKKPVWELDIIHHESYDLGRNIGYNECLEEIQMNRDENWIPCSKRLPNEEEFAKAYVGEDAAEFLVTIEGATVSTTLYFKNGKWFDERLHHYKVVAWKPLPEPYRAADKPDWKENMLNTFLAGH